MGKKTPRFRKKRPPEDQTLTEEEKQKKLFLEHLASEFDSVMPSSKANDQDLSPKPLPRKGKKRGKAHDLIIDLHGRTLSEATDLIDKKILALKQRNRAHNQLKVRVVTGKGLHSGPEGSVLIAESYDYVVHRYALDLVSIDDPPAQITHNGIPINGHFDFILKIRQ